MGPAVHFHSSASVPEAAGALLVTESTPLHPHAVLPRQDRLRRLLRSDDFLGLSCASLTTGHPDPGLRRELASPTRSERIRRGRRTGSRRRTAIWTITTTRLRQCLSLMGGASVGEAFI